MEKLKPKLFSVMKTYTKEQFVKDVVAGIIVAIIALPLSIALALASGVGPEQGIYTAIVAGFLISFFVGSRVQIAGPTAAFATIVAGIVAQHGMDGLVVATVMAGIILIVMGLCHMGSLIKFIPYSYHHRIYRRYRRDYRDWPAQGFHGNLLSEWRSPYRNHGQTESFSCLLSTFLYFRASQPINIYVFCTFPLFFPL